MEWNWKGTEREPGKTWKGREERTTWKRSKREVDGRKWGNEGKVKRK